MVTYSGVSQHTPTLLHAILLKMNGISGRRQTLRIHIPEWYSARTEISFLICEGISLRDSTLFSLWLQSYEGMNVHTFNSFTSWLYCRDNIPLPRKIDEIIWKLHKPCYLIDFIFYQFKRFTVTKGNGIIEKKDIRNIIWIKFECDSFGKVRCLETPFQLSAKDGTRENFLTLAVIFLSRNTTSFILPNVKSCNLKKTGV